MTQIATLVYAMGIAGLFWLNRERNCNASKALWLPVIWLLINSSRPVSVWLRLNPANSTDMYLEGSPFDRNIYLMIVAAGVAVLWGRRSAVTRFLQSNPAIIAFFLYCAISCVWADHPDVSLKRWIKAIGDVVMVLIVLSDRERVFAVKQVLARVGFILIPVSILLIKYYPDMARYYSKWEGKMFVAGVAEDKNMLGMTCLIFGLGAWWRVLGAFRDYKRKERVRFLIAHGALLAMVCWLFWMANSMTSISCFAMAAAVITATTLFRFARRSVGLHSVVSGVISTAFSVLFLNVGGGALETMGRNSTLTGRTDIWKGLLKVGANPVFGTGFQSFWVGEHLRKVWNMGGLLNGINESHNGYLEVYLNLGAVGVVLLVMLLLTGYVSITKRLGADAVLGTLCLGFFTTAVIYGFTEASGFGIMNPVWFAFLLAVTKVPKSNGVVIRDGYTLDTHERALPGKSEPGSEGAGGWWAGRGVHSGVEVSW